MQVKKPGIPPIGLIFMLFTLSCSRADINLMDKFNIDQTKNIMRPENFGIANGRITTGIECNDLISIKGIWAPPYVSSDFSFQATINGKSAVKPTYIWHPFYIERAALIEEGLLAQTNTLLVPEGRGFIFSMHLKNQKKDKLKLDLGFSLEGTLDKMLADSSWGFSAPQSSTSTVIKKIGENSVALVQGDNIIVVYASNDLAWDSTRNRFEMNTTLASQGEKILYFNFSIGKTDDALKQGRELAEDPKTAIANSYNVYDQRISELYKKLPRFESDNASLVHFYDRSLVPLLLNRWDVPEFKLKPFYSTGSVRGGCVGDYLWNVGECLEILSVFDPVATKAHIRQFLETGVKKGFGFCPVNGGMLHRNYFYPINQEKVIGLTYNYIKNTGDVEFLNEKIGNGTIIDSIISEALYLDNLDKPVAMVDYNTCDPQRRGGQSHLELRTPIGKLNYTNVMPDLNGRRYLNYILAAHLSELAGTPRPDLLKRAEDLKKELKKELWDPENKWFVYRMPDSKPPVAEDRYTVQMFYLLGTGVLDDEEESGLLGHLNEDEFLSEYGLHSLAKHDPAYFQPDVDNGGPGSCTCFPLNIAKTLYIMNKSDMADDILKRILWWGERMPYWGDSFYADTMRYREETPLQCTIDAITGAQCIIFGMFGISPGFDGSVRINPHLPSFAGQISLKGIRLRNHVFNVTVKNNSYQVSCQGKNLEVKTGKMVTLSAQGLLSAN